jgi:hypothetical protein
MALNVLICCLSSLFIAPSGAQLDDPIDPAKVEEQLQITFGTAIRWRQETPYQPVGSASARALFRRAYVLGWNSASSSVAYSEQTLKVGWPFTTVRGFVRRIGAEIQYEGAIPLSSPESSDRGIEFMPTQPVWPGLVINSAIIALLIGVGFSMVRRTA